MGPSAWGKALRLALGIASLHSVVLGLTVYLLARPFLSLFGFETQGDLFYPKQSGVFLLALGLGYGLAARDPLRHPGLVALTIVSKTLAVVFLLSEAILFQAPGFILAAAVVDATFAVAIGYIAWGYYKRR